MSRRLWIKNFIKKSVLLGVLLVFLVSGFVVVNYRHQINPEIIRNIEAKNPESSICAVIFGAAVWSRNRPSHALRDRLMTGVELYQQKKVNCLLFSGGASRSGSHDEVKVMKTLALKNGIPEEALRLDPHGHNTQATIKNLPEDVEHFVFVSNDFHLARIKLFALKEGVSSFELQTAKYLNGRYLKEGYFFVREILGIFWYFKWEIFTTLLFSLFFLQKIFLKKPPKALHSRQN